MTDRPIIFSGAMVRAWLAGRKGQTRRILKPQPQCARPTLVTRGIRFAEGDRLWVRETWQTGMTDDGPRIAFRADGHRADIDAWTGPDEGAGPSFNYDACPGARWHDWLPDVERNDGPWRSPIHMPRWASRLTLLVSAVRVERLQDITEADAIAEGIEPVEGGFWKRYEDGSGIGYVDCPIGSYASLWSQINGVASWCANPWVVVITASVAPRGAA